MKTNTYSFLMKRLNALLRQMHSLIIATIAQNGGRISYIPYDGRDLHELDNSEFIVSTLYGKHDNPNIGITDVYLGEHGQICADGIDRATDQLEYGFQILSEQYGDILDFIAFVKGWNKAESLPDCKTECTESTLLEFASELAEKAMVDKHGMLPSEFYDGGNYIEQYQDEFNDLYDHFYDELVAISSINNREPDREQFAFIYPIDRFDRDASDEEIIQDWESNHDDLATEKLTPDELAALINDESFADQVYWVRFIAM